jgi:hypothetical protein
MNNLPSLNSFDSFKRTGGGDVVEYDIVSGLKKSGQLSQSSLSSALLPFEEWYRTR